MLMLSISLRRSHLLAQSEHMPSFFVNGLTTLLNGAFNTVDAATSPFAFAAVVSAGGLAWVCRIELAELDRQGSKPSVKRH